MYVWGMQMLMLIVTSLRATSDSRCRAYIAEDILPAILQTGGMYRACFVESCLGSRSPIP